MKVLTVLSLLIASSFAKTYKECTNCRVVSTEGGVNWGVQNKEWCTINDEFCDENAEKNQCATFPKYLCCEGCDIVTEDETGKWGIENGKWCGIKDSCFNVDIEVTDEPEDTEEEPEEKLCQDVIIKDMYTADPAPLVVGDTLYLYTTHDEDVLKNDFYTMENWYVFSTKDMVNWTNHGQILSLDDIEWADDRAWAPQCVEKDGKFYLYFPAHVIDGGMAVGVAVADSPVGPFKDLGKPLVYEEDWIDFDPTVLIDDDGQAYLYFGNPELRYVKLNDDMISYDETVGIVHVEMTDEAFGKGERENTSYGEGPYFFKKNGLYYMAFAGFRPGKQTEYLGYSMSENPTGPWKYAGVLMTEEGGVFTNHPAVVDFQGKSFLFYHNGNRPGGGDFHRSVAYTEFTYNEDGTIDVIPMCPKDN